MSLAAEFTTAGSSAGSGSAPGGLRSPSPHLLRFYEDDELLAKAVAQFVEEGLLAGDVVTTIATAHHTQAVERNLRFGGVNVDDAVASGRLLCLDADETLGRFMRGGEPNRERFEDVVGHLMGERAAIDPGARLRAYGEMVDVLWKREEKSAALHLEELWSELQTRRPFTLLCAYAIGQFYKEPASIHGVCAAHTHLVGLPRTRAPRSTAPETSVPVEYAEALAREILHREEVELALRESLRDLRSKEEELRQSEEQLRDFVENGTVSLHRVGADGRIIWANRGELDLLGYAAEEYIGRPIADFHVDQHVISDILARLARGEALHEYEARLRAKDGAIKHVLINSSGYFRDGKFVHSRCFTRDITDRRRVEQAWQFLAEASAALATSLDYEATLREVVDLAVPRIADWCAVDIVAPDGSLEQLAVAHIDPSKRELAQEWRRRWPPREEALLHQVIKTGLPRLLPEIADAMIEAGATDPEQRRAGGQLRLRSAMVVPLMVGRQAFGALSFATAESGRRYRRDDLILATEIGRRASLAIENARAYSEAHEAIRTRDNFLAIASHELRTPLSALSVLLSSLARGAASGRLLKRSPEAIVERINKAERQMAQVVRLVDRLLDVSRLSTCDLRLEREQTDLAEIAREVISRYEDIAVEAGGRIDLETTGPAVGLWDRARLDEVLTNLVGNAVKYARGSHVAISLSSESSGHVRLTVRDEGPGIPLQDQERIFDQFERATDSENMPGMGLGLWLVRRIVTAHGGTINLDSMPGHGSTFSVLLPVDNRESPTRTEDFQPGS